MIHPLIPIIRWWLVAFVLLVLAAVWPSVGIYAFAGFSWTPLGLMYPTFATATTCSGACTTLWTTASITFSGYASATCSSGNCTDRNATFAVSYGSLIVGGCRGFYSFFPCAIDAGTNSMSVFVLSNATHTQVEVQWYCAFDLSKQVIFLNTTSLGASPIDCTTISSLSLSLSTDDCTAAGACDSTSVTCTATFT